MVTSELQARNGSVGTANAILSFLRSDLLSAGAPTFLPRRRGGGQLRTLVTLRFGINNIGNRQPPLLNFGNEANTDTSKYRLLGRSFFASLSCYIASDCANWDV